MIIGKNLDLLDVLAGYPLKLHRFYRLPNARQLRHRLVVHQHRLLCQATPLPQSDSDSW